MKYLKRFNQMINETVDKQALKRKVIDNKFTKLVKTGTEDPIDNFISKYYNDSDTLEEAAENGYLPLVKYFLDKGDDPSKWNNYAIQLASKNGHLPVVKYLLSDERVDPSADDNYAIRWTLSNTVNAKSKYLFLTPNKRTAFNYSQINKGMDVKINDKSGVLSFALKKSKGKRLTSNELNYSNMGEFESILDYYKNKGYDYVIIVPDGKNYVILNPSILKLVGKNYTYDAINKQNMNESLNLDNCEELYHGTFICKGTYETYHLSTTSNLEVGKKMNHEENTKNTERGGGGDYIYSSLEPKKWLDVLSQETSSTPTYLYKLIIKNPKYKKSFNLFGKTTPAQFLSEPNNTIVKEFIGNIKNLPSLKEGEIVYHGSPNDFSEFKLKKGTMFNANDMSPIFLSTDKDSFAKYYAKENGCLYTIELSDDVNLFDFRKMVDWWELSPGDYGYKLYNDMISGEYDLTPYNDDSDKLYDYMQSGEYSILERPWFYKWLKNNNYDGAYVVETRTLNLFVFNPNKMKIINKDCNLNESKIRGFIRKILRESLLKESTEYFTQDEQDEYQITKVVPDDYHRYERLDGITYELNINGGDKIAYVSEIEHTEENLFYNDQVDRYVKYLENGGILESFPVNENPLGGAYSLEEMIEYLNERENFDLMYDLIHIEDSKAHFSLYDALDSLYYDSESYGIADSILSKIKNLNDLDKYYGKNYLSSFDGEEIEDYGYYWEPEYYQGFKKILEYWNDNKEYTLTDMNHRFMAVKRLGVKKVFVDPN